MCDALAGTIERVRWANEHIHALHDEVHAWVTDHSDATAADYYPDADAFAIRWNAAEPPRFGA